MDDFETFVRNRLATGKGERAPFCPFLGPEKVGYCDAAYMDLCYSCEEARGEWEEKRKRETV